MIFFSIGSNRGTLLKTKSTEMKVCGSWTSQAAELKGNGLLVVKLAEAMEL